MSTISIARAYDAPSWWYDLRGLFILTFSYRTGLGGQVRAFGEHIGDRHLEVAIGSGSLFELVVAWRRLRGRGQPKRVVGFDLAPSMLAGAKKRFARTPWMELAETDVAALPWADASFDSANAANCVHCFPDVDAALHELARVLRPGGTLVLNALLHPRGGAWGQKIASAINTWGTAKGILKSPFDRGTIIAQIQSAGFTIDEATTSGNALTVVARKGAL